MVSVTGNVTANNVIATTIVNAASYTGTVVSVTGNVTANYFVGNGAALTATTGANVTGTVANATSALRLNAASSILAGNVAVGAQTFPKNTPTLTANVTITGLTTGHKVIVTPANVQTAGTWVSAAFPAAANVLSIQIQNSTGGALTTAAFDLTYWAWV